MRHHYTVVGHLEKITAEGVIRPAWEGVTKIERLAVWFSTNPVWENTVRKLMKEDGSAASFEEHFQASQGVTALVKSDEDVVGTLKHIVFREVQPARISVADEIAPFRWEDFKRLSGIKPRDARDLYQVALMLGARPGEWYVSFDPVPADKWLAVQVYDGETWVSYEPARI